jgi:radical SAM-linked protein
MWRGYHGGMSPTPEDAVTAVPREQLAAIAAAISEIPAGFTAHPKISYANAAPTGAASEAEYVELGVTEECDPAAVRVALDASLPDDFVVRAVVDAAAWQQDSGALTPLADLLEASHWELALPGVSRAEATAAVDAFLGVEHVEVSRMTKNGRRTFDARGAVVRLAVRDPAASSVDGADRADVTREYAIMDLVVRHDQPTVRPDDVLTGLRLTANLEPPEPPRLTRLAQGPLDRQTGTVADPLAAPRT